MTTSAEHLNPFRKREMTELNEWKRDKLMDKLTIFFCRYLQAVERPPTKIEEFDQQETLALDRYRNDPIFHAKVQHLTAHILRIVEEL